MFKRRRKLFRKRGSGRRPIRRAVKRARRTAFKKRVLRVVNRDAETKRQWLSFPRTQFNSTIALSSDCMQIVPGIYQGTDKQQRVGEQIQPKSLTIRGIIQFQPVASADPHQLRKLGVRLMCITPRMYSTYSSAKDNFSMWYQTLLRKGSLTTGFDGYVEDYFAPINTDAIKVHFDKRMVLTQWNNTGTFSSILQDNSNVTRFFKHKFIFKNQKWKYDSDRFAIDMPCSMHGNAYIMLLGYCWLDNSTPDGLDTRVAFQYITELSFKD